MFEKINKYFEENKVARFRFKQFEDAVFKQFVSDFDEITVFPKQLRNSLKENFEITSMFLVDSYKTKNTVKFVFKTYDGHFVESVLMFHNDGRRTVCVSCQVFCAVGCSFCATGANQFRRSLLDDEIVEQVFFISRYLKQSNSFDFLEKQRVTNVVFMGMGEPFLNYENVTKAIEVFNDENKFNIGARHIIVSTSGIVPKIYEYGDFPFQSRLAISLHAPNDSLRSQIMAINKKYPLKDLMKACDFYTKTTNKRVSYEYVLIKNVNDRPEHAKELAYLLSGKLAYVNLLVYNPHEFAMYEKPEKEDVVRFKNILVQKGIEVSIRKSMGDDISGACGQLSGKSVVKK